ncbi:MAG: hypothetical protein GY760_14360 [Deltaproteobacteria bacterium]|nr:hypothetical protein [Deltaproteobacteria bacterium]
MGWKGTVRSIGAAVRAAERDAKQRQRELEKQQKQYAKMQELDQAAYEVEAYENHVEIIQSLHKECSNPIDWKNIVSSKEPKKPNNSKKFEKAAITKAEAYKPGFIDKLFKREEKKKKCLEKNISKAIDKDEAEHKDSVSDWEEKINDWKDSVELAQLLLSGVNEAKIKAIKDLNPFSEISNLGSSLSVSVSDEDLVETSIFIHGDDIVPSEVKSLLKSGKLSVKKTPKGLFNEIYQDYVCSCVLRVANELFSAIPDNMVIVTAVDELLNTKTGHLEKSPILSACISRSTLKSLNMETIDPSDSMGNFIHNMSFKKTKGFEAVSRVESGHLEP